MHRGRLPGSHSLPHERHFREGTGRYRLGMDPGNDRAASVEELLLERLGGSGLPVRTENLVVASLLGEAELAAVVSGEAGPGPRPVPGATADAMPPARVYLQSIVVEGFRGIGPQAALRLQPGPGLTLIAGRNGSGKSSFAEAAELVMTGDNKRWSGRTAVWRAGWRNLHTHGPSRICVELAVDGQPGVTKVTREWPQGCELDDAAVFAQAHGAPRQPLSALGWQQPVGLYRPPTCSMLRNRTNPGWPEWRSLSCGCQPERTSR